MCISYKWSLGRKFHGSHLLLFGILQGPVGKSTIPPVPPASAAHARMLRKGSTDHLAIDVETESDRLIGNAMEIDKDKGLL